MEELVEKAKKGDKQAFTSLIISLQDELYKIAKIRLKNDDDIYDAIQETIITAFNSIKKLKQTQYFKTWLIRILINKSNYIHREKSKRVIVAFEDIDMIEYTETSNIEQVEVKLNFNYICSKLKYEDRVIIILYYMEKFTDKEIGRILNLKENTVKTKRTRAKKKIKSILESGGYYE